MTFIAALFFLFLFSLKLLMNTYDQMPCEMLKLFLWSCGLGGAPIIPTDVCCLIFNMTSAEMRLESLYKPFSPTYMGSERLQCVCVGHTLVFVDLPLKDRSDLDFNRAFSL